MSNSKTKLLMGFALGAAVGIAIGYLLSGKTKEDLIVDLKDASDKVKEEINNQFEKGKAFADELKIKVSEIIATEENESKKKSI